MLISLYSVRSERAFYEELDYQLLYRWFLDMGLLEPTFDPTAFTIADLYPANPNNYAYGNAGRNILRGPGAAEVNFSMAKNFPIGERARFQFRFETFNLFNHANFGSYTTTENSAVYGKPTANTNLAYAPREAQFGFRLTF